MNLARVLNSRVVSFTCSVLGLLILSFALASFAVAQEAPAAVKSKSRLGVTSEQPAVEPFVKIEGGFMVPYKTTIPGTDTEFEMVPVPGGTFTMGSPTDEEGRLADEGPQFDVVVKPFWIGKHEVTWDEYQRFMDMTDVFQKLNRRKIRTKPASFQWTPLLRRLNSINLTSLTLRATSGINRLPQ